MTETVASSCPDCYSRAEGFPGIFDIRCAGCRTALAMSEPCKLIRKSMVQTMERNWGEVGNWKAEPSCGCKALCVRLLNRRGT